ncbi:MAG: polyphosphate glucokinase, partial [Pseudonocardiales bacterium]|nr:polyphosphate glucokinase [Pseudonocardiales bacterium]
MTAPVPDQAEHLADAAYGIDIGGSGIKGAIVDTRTGELKTQRVRIPTPPTSTPDNVAEVVLELVTRAKWDGRVGATFPAVIKNGVARSAANVD